ncbi:MAG: YhgE/Pip domain-containing protein [Ruminococcus sp.]|nr:YhgE/Pip domain-containing protein [Ruminococcus sp.]
MKHIGKEEKNPSFLKRHFNVIATVCIVLIPTIYTTLFLGSMWDPYGNINNLPVAVVNQDMPVTFQEKTLSVGEELVENLKDNESLDFSFVDFQTAQEGLRNGTYYMAITIPENTSANAATVLDDIPQNVQLYYETNPGSNYIASKMSETAMEKLRAEVSSTLTEAYTETLFEQLGTIGDGMQDAADGAKALQDGAVNLKDGSITLSDNLKLFAESTLTFKEGFGTLTDGLESYTAGVSAVDEGTKQLADGAEQLKDGVSPLFDGSNQLKDGAEQLQSGINTYTNGVSDAYNGSVALYNGCQQLSDGSQELHQGALQLYNGSKQLENGLTQLSYSLSQSFNAETSAQLEQISVGLTQLQNGINTLKDSVSDSNIATTNAMQAVVDDLQSLGNGLLAMQSAQKSVIETETFQNLDSASQQELLECFSEPMKELSNTMTKLQADITALADSLESATQLPSAIRQLADGAEKVLPTASKAIATLSGGLQSVQNAVDYQLLPGASALTNGTVNLSDGSQNLVNGLKELTNGADTLSVGLKTLNSNSNSLQNGTATLHQGITAVSEKIPDMINAVTQLESGAKVLSDGTGQLVAQNDTLLSGARQLQDGSNQLKDGSEQLADGSVTLKDGLITLTNGSETLWNALQDGATEVKDINSTEQTYEMFASPVNSMETFASEVPNNGHAMAAYMMAVGLWVACLAYCIMFNPYETQLKGKNTLTAWSRKLPVLCLIAWAQAIVMVCLLHLFNGFTPQDILQTILVAGVSSMAYMAIIYCLNLYCGKIGSFILLVLMVLQLSGCAGTYPSELSSKFYRTIKPFMPFTYTVEGFRSTIASKNDITDTYIVMIGLTVVFTLLMIPAIRRKLKREQTFNLSEESENNTISSLKKIESV